MKTVMYFDYVRNRKEYGSNILMPLFVCFVLFLLSVITDKVFPQFNVQYMRWPDMVKDLLGLSPWNRSLYGNVWQIVVLFYPLFLIFTIASGMMTSVREEDRLETIVHLNNLSICKGDILLAKGVIWLVQSFLISFLLGVENVVFFICLDMTRMVNTVVRYFATLFLISVLFMGIAVFILSCSRKEAQCRSVMGWLLGITFALARLHAVIRFLSALLIATARGGFFSDKLALVSGKIQVMSILSPVVWCWPSSVFDLRYVWCGAIIFVVCVLSGWSIYTHEKVIDEVR